MSGETATARPVVAASAPPISAGPTVVGAPSRHRSWAAVLREVASDRIDQLVFALTAAVAGFGYSLLLPFAFTQRISFANWGYLDARYAAFTVAFAVGLAWLVTLQVHATRRVARKVRASGRARTGGPLGVLAAVVSLLPGLLCCSPIVPTLVGLLPLSVISRLQTTGGITHFFATDENWLLLGSLALLVASGLWSIRKLTRATCLLDECCVIPAVPGIDGEGAAASRGARREPTSGVAASVPARRR